MDYSFAIPIVPIAIGIEIAVIFFLTAKDAKEYSAKSAKPGCQIVRLCASLRKTLRSLRLLFFTAKEC